ncbi:hypothetical protein, partial [Lachnobacterium bovis]
KSSDELASYFLPEGQKISYGDGIEFSKKISNNLKKVVKAKSLEEYYNNLPEEELEVMDKKNIWGEKIDRQKHIIKVVKAKSLEEYYNNLPEEELEVMENLTKHYIGDIYISCS